MIKDNNLMLGYSCCGDLCSSAFGLNNVMTNFLMASIGALTSFITSYVYNDAQAIYVLIGMIAFDSVTGIMKAIKNGTFSSAKLPRILVIMVIYVSLLSLGWNLAKVNDLFTWVPGALYFGFVTTLTISIIENLHELRIISDNVYNYIKHKMTIIQELLFGSSKKKKVKDSD